MISGRSFERPHLALAISCPTKSPPQNFARAKNIFHFLKFGEKYSGLIRKSDDLLHSFLRFRKFIFFSIVQPALQLKRRISLSPSKSHTQ